jgi:hypothetical protein
MYYFKRKRKKKLGQPVAASQVHRGKMPKAESPHSDRSITGSISAPLPQQEKPPALAPELRVRAVGTSRGDDGRNLLQVLRRWHPPPRQERRREFPSPAPVLYSCPHVLYSYLLPSLLAQRRDLSGDTPCFNTRLALAVRSRPCLRFELFRFYLVIRLMMDGWCCLQHMVAPFPFPLLI